METKTKKKTTTPKKKQNWAIDPETGEKVSKTWLAAKRLQGTGKILDMRAVLK